jgi:hypothetical protein
MLRWDHVIMRHCLLCEHEYVSRALCPGCEELIEWDTKAYNTPYDELTLPKPFYELDLIMAVALGEESNN